MNVSQNIVFIGSVAGSISAIDLNKKPLSQIFKQTAHGSTVTDIQTVSKQHSIEAFSIGLDRCLVLSEYDKSLKKVMIA